MRRLSIVLVAAGILLLATAVPAFAHVTISPEEATKGSDAVITFVAPNEEQVNFTKLEVTFPDDAPIAEALTSPIAGWTSEVTTKKVTTPISTDTGTVTEQVNTVTWTAAAGGGIKPEQFGAFPLSVGLPDADSLLFRVVQTYANGDQVNWVETTPPGGDEPEHPAPVLKLTAGSEDGSSSAPAETSSSSSSDDDSNGLAIAALVVGGVALIVGIVAVVLSRKKPAGSV